MISLLTEIQNRLVAAFASELFEDPAGGEDCAPEISLGALPPVTHTTASEERLPAIVIAPSSGSGSDKSKSQGVIIRGAIYTAGNELAGITAINRMANTIQTLFESRAFSPYRLDGDFFWQFGDEDGDQPRPFYEVTVNLSFKTVPVAMSGR